MNESFGIVVSVCKFCTCTEIKGIFPLIIVRSKKYIVLFSFYIVSFRF